jgi:hypothetical protein
MEDHQGHRSETYSGTIDRYFFLWIKDLRDGSGRDVAKRTLQGMAGCLEYCGYSVPELPIFSGVMN